MQIKTILNNDLLFVFTLLFILFLALVGSSCDDRKGYVNGMQVPIGRPSIGRYH